MAEDNLLPDPDSTPTGNSYEESISPTPETPETPETNEEFSGFGGYGDIQTSQSIVGDEVDQYKGYILNPTDVNTRYHNAAVNQGFFSAMGNGLQRGIFGEIVGGTIEGFGALGNLFSNKGDYNLYSERNFLESLGNAIREGQDENTEIFERNQGEAWQFGDSAWWAKNLPSMMSTISMMIPGAAAGRGAAYIARGAAKAARLSAKVADKVGDVSRSIAGGAAMRHAENMREAYGAFESAREDFLGDATPLEDFKGTEGWQAFVKENKRKPMNKYELADFVGGSAAKQAYTVNSANIFFDILQMHQLTKALKGTRGALKPGSVAARRAAGENVGRMAAAQERMMNLTKFGIMDMGTEGIEELVNYIGTEEGLYEAKRLMGREDKEMHRFMDRYQEYTKDDHFWESGFLGALGGAVFTGITSAAGYQAASKRQKEMLDFAERRKENIQAAGKVAAMAADENVPPGMAEDAARRQFYNIGLEAAMTGQADIAEAQLAVLESQMKEQGASEAQIQEALTDARAQFALAEAAVTEANTTLKSLNLSPREASIFRMTVANNAFAQQGVAKMREEIAPELANIKDASDQRVTALSDMQRAVQEAIAKAKEEGKSTRTLEQQLDVINDALGETETEGDLRFAEEQALSDELAELMLEEETTDEQKARIKEIQEEKRRRAGEGKGVDQRVQVDAALEVQEGLLKAQRADITSEEGLEVIRKAAEKAEAEEAKTDEEKFSKWLSETNNLEELERAFKKEEDPAKRSRIEDRIEQVKTGQTNDAAQEAQERSKDIIVPGPVQAAVDELLKNSDDLALNEEGTHYVSKSTGKKYARTTTWMNQGSSETFDPNSPFALPSTSIGNSVDEYVRDYFDGNLRAPEAYPHITAEQQVALGEQLRALEEQFIANGEKVIAKDVVLFNDMDVTNVDPDAAGVAGTVDLLTVDKDGNFRIYDMKTIRDATLQRSYGAKVVIDQLTGEVKYGAKNSGLKGKHQKQLSVYRMMLMNQLGVNVPEIGIIPIEVTYMDPRNVSAKDRKLAKELIDAYNETDSIQGKAAIRKRLAELGLVADSVKYLGGVIAHTPLTELHNMSEPDVDGIDTSDDTTDEDGPTPEENTVEQLQEELLNLREELDKARASLQRYEATGAKSWATRMKNQINKIENRIKEIEQELFNQEDNNETAELEAKRAELIKQIDTVESLIQNLTDMNATKSVKYELAVDKLQTLQAELAEVEAQLGITPEENNDDQTPSPDGNTMTLEGMEVSFPMSALVDYFAARLNVIEEPGREGHGYLVHAHSGPVFMSEETYRQYWALQQAMNGSLPVTLEIVGTQPVDQLGVTVYSTFDAARDAEVLEATDRKNNYTYRAGKGDSLQIQVKVGDVVVGTMPTTAELMSVAQRRGQANLSTRRGQEFGTESRLGAVRVSENSVMAELSQKEAIENAVAMHELRERIYLANKEQGGTTVNMELRAGETGFGQRAQGSLIFDTEGKQTLASLGIASTLKQHGWGLQLPSADKKAMQVELAGSLSTVSPYQQSEERGNTNRENNRVKRWNSGALFVPLEQNGEVLWVKVPGRTFAELTNGEAIVDQIVATLEGGNEVLMTQLQNILGSNALTAMEEGTWGLFQHNITGPMPDTPTAVYRNGKWNMTTEELKQHVLAMKFDIGVTIEGGSAYSEPADTQILVGNMSWDTMADFIAEEVPLGYAPIVDADGNVQGWTHTLAPAYPFNNSKQKNSNFTNENTARTQLRLAMKPAPYTEVTETEVPKVSDREVVENLTNPDGTVKTPDGKKVDDLSWLDGAFDGADDALFLTPERSAASNHTEKATETDMKVAEEWWAENLPGVPFKRVKGMIKRNGHVGYGIFERGAVEVSNMAVVGTEYHEAFHAVMEMFVDPKRHAKIMAEAEKRYGKLGSKELNEKLAEDFREYMLTDGLSMREKSTIRRFFAELLELIKAFVGAGKNGYQTQRLFQQINRGKFANEVSDTTKNYATRNSLIMANIPEYDMKVQQELSGNIKSAAFRGLRMLQKAAKEGTLTPNMKKMYDELVKLNNMTNAEAKDYTAGSTKREALARQMMKIAFAVMQRDAKTVLTNPQVSEEMKQRFFDLHQTNREMVIDYFSNRPEMISHLSSLMEMEFTAGTDTQVQYDETFEKMNPKDSLSQTVKSLIETTPQIDLALWQNHTSIEETLAAARMAITEGNTEAAKARLTEVNDIVGSSPTTTYFGMPQTMSVDKVYPFMSAHLAGLATPKAMFQKLWEMGDVYPEFKLLAVRLQQEDTTVQAQFFAAFRRGSTAELIMERGKIRVNDVFGNALFNHNKQAMQVAIRDLAVARGQSETAMARGIASGVQSQVKNLKNLSNEDFVKQATNIMEAIGFSTMDPIAMGRVLELNAGDMNFREQLYLAVANVATKLSATIEAAEGQDMKATKELNNGLNHLVSMFAKYDMGAVQTTFTNVEGSRIFNQQVPSFITEWFDKFQRNDMTVAELRKKLEDEFFVDERMYATTFGRILYPAGKGGPFNKPAVTNGTFRAFRMGGIKMGDGVSYLNMDDSQWYEFQLNAMMQPINGMVYLPVTTPSDASNTYLVPATRYQSSAANSVAPIKKHLRDIIAAEFAELQTRPGRFSIGPVNDFMSKHVQRIEENKGMYKIKDTTAIAETLDKAADIAYDALMKEGKALANLPDFVNAVERINDEMTAEGRTIMAQDLAINGYISNWSVGVALAGTPNEFKQNAGTNTVDMQKRHKHILSPGVANAGVSGRTHFTSVTMAESVENLTKYNDALKQFGDAYAEVEVADGQTYVSLEFYKDVLHEHGDLTPEIEAVLDKAIAGEKLDKSEIKLIRPYKPFYYARVFNENTGMFESQQIKNSIFPAIPGLSKDFKALAEWMSDNEIDQVQMSSAHKVGQTKENVELRDSETGAFIGKPIAKKDRPSTVYSLPMTGYRKQVNVTDHWHNDSTNKLASQLEKIVVAAAVRNMGEDGRALAQEFLQTLDEIYKEQLKEFKDQFGLSEGIDFNEAIEKGAFADWLISQLDDGTQPTYVIDLIREGKFTSPAVVGAMRSRVFTGFQQNVNTIKVNGGTQVQVASQFFRRNENRLRGMRVENGKVMPAEIAVSRDFLPAKYRDMSIEEIREQAPEVLQSITLRIPSESLNSGTVVEVVEFLEEGVDGVIVPDEFVTQMGSDFDVDKLFFQFKANDGSKQDKLFDLQVKVFMDQRNLKDIMEPQGFDDFAQAAKDFPKRSDKQSAFIQNNPLSTVTHAMLRSDNMAGVALKGQAANKNVILLDLIRYGWAWEAGEFKIDGQIVRFDGDFISDKVVSLHAQAVAAAMDGAKNPVYGKLGVNSGNFGMFMELLMMSGGNMELAVSVIQSRSATLMGEGHIKIQNTKDGVMVVPMTEAGEAFVEEIVNSDTKLFKQKDGSVALPANPNFFTPKTRGQKLTAKQEMLMASAIGTWKKEVSNNLDFVNKVMRSDKANVAKDTEAQLLLTPNDMGNYGVIRRGFNPGSSEDKTMPVAFTDSIFVKGTMEQMFLDVARLTTFAGDGYLMMKTYARDSKLTQGMTMNQYDTFKRTLAAEEFLSDEVYQAMGERDTKAPKALPEDRSEWSLEQWLRYYRNSKEVKENPDLALVVSKLLVQTNPYNVRGTYFDNITLVGVADDGELKQVTDAMDRLDQLDDPDIFDFVGSIQAYEAQRSRYGMSQSRLTRILPTRVHRDLGSQVGADGILDIVGAENRLQAIQTDVHNPNIPYLHARNLEEAIEKAAKLKKAAVYATVGGHVVFPVNESEEGLLWSVALQPNAGQNFSGKPIKSEDIIDHRQGDRDATFEVEIDGKMMVVDADGKVIGSAETHDSRLGWYKPELEAETKIEFLKQRFRRSGLNVKVKMDSSLPVNGRVVFDKGTATVSIHPEMLQGDTIAHEFGHILLEALGHGHPLVQQAIAELKGTELWNEIADNYPDYTGAKLEMEVLTTWIGRRGNELITSKTGRVSKIKTLYNRIMRAIGKLFGIQPKATEQLAQELMFGFGELSLGQLQQTYDQRGTQTATDVLNTTREELSQRLNFLKQTGGTSVQAQEALDEAQARYAAATGGLVIERLNAIADMADDIVGNAVEATSILDGIQYGTNKELTENQVIALNRANQVLNDIETMLRSLDSMETIAKDAADMTDQDIAFQGLADKIDSLREAKNNLGGAVADALSDKLKSQSTNKSLITELDADKKAAGNVFMMGVATSERLRSLMTDVDFATQGALGVKEFKNPVVQMVNKLVADTLEAARLDGKSAEAEIATILSEFDGSLSDIIDMETGALKGEYSAEYYKKREVARKLAMSGKDPLALLKFDANNSIQEYTKEYYTQWLMKSDEMQRIRERAKRARDLMKAGFRRGENAVKLKELRKELLEALKENQEAFLKFHDVAAPTAEFTAALEEARAKVEAAEAAQKEGKDVAKQDFYALRDFIADHGVIDINGVATPTTGKFAEVTVKEEFKNESFTGEVMPAESFKDASWAANQHKETITKLKAVMSNAAGAHGQVFVERGFIPMYDSIRDKTAKEIARKKLERLGENVKDATGFGKEAKDFASTVALDSRGNRIFVRQKDLYTPASEKQLKQLQGMDKDALAKHLKQFVKDAHMESAKRSLESVAYLTREVFEGSQIIDGKHVIRVGKQGKTMREAATKLAGGTRIADALDLWFEGVLGDNWEDSSSMDGIVGTIQQYTSLMGVGLNISAWINNFGYGTLQRHLEFRGRDQFSKENSKKAHRLISGNLGAITKDLVKPHGGQFTNKASAIIHTFDVADDQRELPFNMKESMADKAMAKAFLGQTLGEVVMQNQVLFAMMLEQEVYLDKEMTQSAGSLYEAYQLKDGKLQLKSPDLYVKSPQTGEAVLLDNNWVAGFRNKVKSINHHIHGAYNKQDAGTWQRHWLGRIGMQFRRWLPMGIKKRFGERMYNESREREEVGDYRALFEILKTVISDVRSAQGFIETLKAIKEADPLVYKNAKRAIQEMIISAALFMMVAGIMMFALGGDDDDLHWTAGLAINRMERLGEEMATYTPVGIIKLFHEITENPMASVSKLGDLGDFLMYAGQDAMASLGLGDYAMYTTGNHKGKSKTVRKLGSLVPVWSHLRRIDEVWENHQQFSMLYGWVK